jgi:hypothetical protein
MPPFDQFECGVFGQFCLDFLTKLKSVKLQKAHRLG